jgi:DNA-binding response OmpR family regulator
MNQRAGPVLIVEDDPDVRHLLVRRFTRAGHRTAAVDSGEAALASVDADPPSLAVVDITLPGMDGWEFIRRFRALGASGSAPVYVVSILDPTESAELPEIEGHVVKPFRMTDIDRMVQAIPTGGN